MLGNTDDDAGNRAYLIDASIYIFRYYFSMPSQWFAENGRPTETVYGFACWLLRFLNTIKPTGLALCFDESLGSGFRHRLYPGYKQSRVLPDDDLAFQMLACKQLARCCGAQVIASDEYEADDLIGTYATLASAEGRPATIVSKDKDLAQLIYRDSDILWDYPDGTRFSRTELEEKLGIDPRQVADYLALMGDASDDIPGVPGVGKKTAEHLLGRFKDWSAIKEGIPQVEEMKFRGAKRIATQLTLYREQVDLALSLTTLCTDVAGLSIEDLDREPIDGDGLKVLTQSLGFPSTIEKQIDLLLDA